MAPTPTNLNFSDTNPPPPAGRQNVHWIASEPPYGIPVDINGVVETLLFRDLSGNFPIAGAPGGASLIVFEIPLAPSAPGEFIVAHGLPAAPAFIIVQMSSSGEIWTQEPIGWDATNLYLVASDAGITGTATCFMSLPDAVIPLDPDTLNPFSVPHGLAGTPSLALIQMSHTGAIWFQSTPYDATNLNMQASFAGTTGTAYVWLTMPAINTLSLTAKVALAPSAPGNFTVAHGLSVTPILAIIRMSSGGEIWFQAPPYDATNLNLVASDAGITGEAEVWTGSGITGVIGPTGATGSAGTRGSLWYEGSGAPGSIGGQANGDFYLNTANGDVWEFISGGSPVTLTWTNVGNIKGATGAGSTGSTAAFSFADAEIPSGLINGSNTTYTLLYAPSPAASLQFLWNGLLQKQGVDYTLTGANITITAGSPTYAPGSTDSLIAWYRH